MGTTLSVIGGAPGSKARDRLDHRRITLVVRPGSTQAVRARVMHEWQKSLLHQIVPRLIAKWESRLGLRVAGYFLQRMKTKWGVQPQGTSYPVEHGTREKAEGPVGICHCP